MKKIILTLLILISTTGLSFSEETNIPDKYSKEYLQNHKHISLLNPIAENMIEHYIKSSLQKETKGKFKVNFDGYTLSSMKKGIFKNLEITGKDVITNDIKIPYLHLKSIDNYNYIDYTTSPISFKSDINFLYDFILTEDSLNTALQNKTYDKVLGKINNIAYPMFQVKGVSTKIINNEIYILTEYNFPIAPTKKNRVFVASTNFKVENGKIKVTNIKLNSAYGNNIALHKVANLLNLLNPLEHTMTLLNSKEYKTIVENVNIVDNNIQINGKIIIKGD